MFYTIILALVTVAACFYSNWLAAQRAKAVNNQRIVDTVHDLFEPTSKHLVEVLLALPILFVLSTRQWSMALRVLHLYCLLMLFRCVLVHATIFPSIDPSCDRPFICLGNCNDYMYSGHTILLTLSVLALVHLRLIPLSLGVAYCFLVMVLITSARNHYFIDTLIAFFFAMVAWHYCPSTIVR
uniref:Sphingomyelin synthase-like domain-containing protein n=1 Tax=viral metagenome TaxID=1070528 RepID=A0A6C0BQR6_9ZZZZ